MCKEVFEIVKGMDRRNIEMQLCLQCAPTISGLKTSNLFIVPREDEALVRIILKQTGLLSFRLAYDRKRVVFLVFNRAALQAYLNDSQVTEFFSNAGYTSTEFGYVLRQRGFST